MRKPLDPEHIERLSLGEAETSNLAEFLALDFSLLMHTLIGGAAIIPTEKQGVVERMQFFGQQLLEFGGIDYLLSLSHHASDTVRGLAVFGLAHHHEEAAPETLLDMVRPFAADHHWAVREWGWMAVRPHLVRDLTLSIDLFVPWTGEADVNIRRFAVEALRPRGVWCKSITALRENPDLGLPLLEPMRQEPEKYAQDSVANWLNDAAKDKPDWVRSVCRRWQEEAGDSVATKRLIKRALRSIN